MKKPIISFLILSMFTANASGNVDIVAIDGTPFVTWYTDQVYIASYPLGSPSTPVPVGNNGYYPYASICYSTPASGDRLIVACSGYWLTMPVDTVYLLEPVSLNILNQRSLSVLDLGFSMAKGIGELHLPRYCDGSDSFAVVASIGDCTTDAGVSLVSASLSYPDIGPMLLSDTLMANIGYGWQPPDLRGPVILPGLEPLSISCHQTWTPLYFEACILSHLHQEEPTIADDVGEMYTHGIWGYYGEETFDISISALGSSSSGGVGLWSDSSGVQFYSVFVDSIAPASTDVYPFSHPTITESTAMTCNPSDNGILLAWYRDGEIRVRHWENEWNDFDHVVASGQASVSVSNIAVCSVDDGYWVAWLPEGAELPVLAYVDRGTVTGIVSFEEPVGIPVILHPSQNPFRESVNLTVEGNPLPQRLDVFDITGRLIRVLENDSMSSTFLWDGRNTSGQEMPPGTYFIQASTTGIRSTVQLVKL